MSYVAPEPIPAVEAPARSGAAGLSPRQVRDRLAKNGWTHIPIRAHDDGSKAAGKAPTIREWQRFAEFDAEMPTAADRRRWDCEGPGTGIPCGHVLGIDIDVRDPVLVAEIVRLAIEAYGDTPFIRQGSAPKTLLVYRAADPIPKRPFKANDGSGDGLDIMGVGSQFVAFGVHPRTCRPYAWLGAETPLTTSPSAAPSVTAEQVDIFLDRVRRLMPLSKTGGQARGPGGASSEIVRDAEGFVVDGRELHLARCVWRAVTDGHIAGEALSEADVTAAAWAEFERTARVDVGGRRWSPDHCADKVRGTLDRIKRRVVKLPPRPAAVEATYLDEALPLDVAEAEVARLVAEFFEREAPTFKGAQTLYEIKHQTNPLVLPPGPFGVVLRIEAGIGKTETAICAIAEALRRGLAVTYAVPTVELGDAVAARFKALGVAARVWRGREKPDPDAPGEMMCRDLQAVADARRAGARYIASAVCSAKAAAGTVRQCQHFDVCGHVRQKRAEPVVWIVTHAMIFNAKPAAIPKADALVIDESFHGHAIPRKAAVLAVDAIERAGLPDNFSDARVLQHVRRALVEALRQAADGPIARGDLEAAGITHDVAREARKLEWARFLEPAIVPGQAAKDREERADRVADINREVKLLAGLWNEISEFLDSDYAASGRLIVASDGSGARVVRRRSLNALHIDWRCPTLILDATAPPADILSIVLGMPVEMRASIRARWHEGGRVCQVVGGPQSSNALGANGQSGGERSIADLARFVALRAALAYPVKIGVVVQKDLVKRFKAHDLGSNVDVRHFGALAGLDHWRDYGGVILIGRTAPAPGEMEADAGVLTGAPIERTAEPFAIGGILLRDGSVRGTNKVIRLADPVAEACRWQVCEGNLIQALGRIRPLRAHGRSSFFIDILCDVPLPIVVDEVKRWERPPAWAAMATDGVVYTSVADVMVARPDLAPTAEAARWLLARSPGFGVTSKGYILLDVTPNPTLLAKRVRIKRINHEPSEILLLPNGPTNRGELRRRLEKLFGRLDEFRIEGEADPRERAWAAARDQLVVVSTGGVRIERSPAADGFETLGFEISVVTTIYERCSATRSELQRWLRPRPDAEKLDQALVNLVANGTLVETTVIGSGRPSTGFSVSPDDEAELGRRARFEA